MKTEVKVNEEDGKSFMVEMSDGSLVEVVRDSKGIMVVTMDFINQVVDRMKMEDTRVSPQCTQSLIMNTFNTSTMQNQLDVMIVVRNVDGSATVWSSNKQLRNAVEIDSETGRPALFMNLSSNELVNMDPTGKFKIPNVPKTFKQKKKVTYGRTLIGNAGMNTCKSDKSLIEKSTKTVEDRISPTDVCEAMMKSSQMAPYMPTPSGVSTDESMTMMTGDARMARDSDMGHYRATPMLGIYSDETNSVMTYDTTESIQLPTITTVENGTMTLDKGQTKCDITTEPMDMAEKKVLAVHDHTYAIQRGTAELLEASHDKCVPSQLLKLPVTDNNISPRKHDKYDLHVDIAELVKEGNDKCLPSQLLHTAVPEKCYIVQKTNLLPAQLNKTIPQLPKSIKVLRRRKSSSPRKLLRYYPSGEADEFSLPNTMPYMDRRKATKPRKITVPSKDKNVPIHPHIKFADLGPQYSIQFKNRRWGIPIYKNLEKRLQGSESSIQRPKLLRRNLNGQKQSRCRGSSILTRPLPYSVKMKNSILRKLGKSTRINRKVSLNMAEKFQEINYTGA